LFICEVGLSTRERILKSSMRLKKKKQATEELCDAVFMGPSLANETEELRTDRFSTFREGDERLEEANALLKRASELLELDNHSGAIQLISKAAELVPWHPKIAQLKLHSENTLLAMLESKLGNLEAIPFVQLRDEEILWLNLDRKTRFVLEKIDGRLNLGKLLSLPEMPRLELARILHHLLDDGVIAAKTGHPFPLKQRPGL